MGDFKEHGFTAIFPESDGVKASTGRLSAVDDGEQDVPDVPGALSEVTVDDLGKLPLVEVALSGIEPSTYRAEDNMVRCFRAGWRQLNPVLLKRGPDGVYLIKDGFRRVAAFREAGRTTIEARVIPEEVSETTADLYGLAMNAQRSPNEARDAKLILQLHQGFDGCPGLSARCIAEQTGIPLGTVKRHLRKQSLIPDLVDIWAGQGMTTRVADQIASGLKGDEEAQKQIVERFHEKLEGNPEAVLTAEDVSDLAPVKEWAKPIAEQRKSQKPAEAAKPEAKPDTEPAKNPTPPVQRPARELIGRAFGDEDDETDDWAEASINLLQRVRRLLPKTFTYGFELVDELVDNIEMVSSGNPTDW